MTPLISLPEIGSGISSFNPCLDPQDRNILGSSRKEVLKSMPWEATLYFQLDMNKEVFLFQFLWKTSYASVGSQIETK